jgi:hypothetical protein
MITLIPTILFFTLAALVGSIGGIGMSRKEEFYDYV